METDFTKSQSRLRNYIENCGAQNKTLDKWKKGTTTNDGYIITKI